MRVPLARVADGQAGPQQPIGPTCSRGRGLPGLFPATNGGDDQVLGREDRRLAPSGAPAAAGPPERVGAWVGSPPTVRQRVIAQRFKSGRPGPIVWGRQLSDVA
jgi:hypothetical protein